MLGEGKCAAMGCLQNFHRVCVRHMCKQCCISHSGCTAPKHQLQHLTYKQREKMQTIPRPVTTTPSFSSQTESHATSAHLERSLSPCSLSTLKDLISSPTTLFLETQAQHRHAEQVEGVRLIALERQEEQSYQAALAASLGAPYITPQLGPTPVSSFAGISEPSHSRQLMPATPVQFSPVKTVPYQPTITRHMNADWMRLHKDNTKKSMKVPRLSPNNKFWIVFWGKVKCSYFLVVCMF